MPWQLIEYKGHPAVTMGWENDWDKPVESRSVWFHPHEKWDEDYYSQFTQLRLHSENRFSCISRRDYQYHNLDTTGWTFERTEQPIKAPGRGGKDWRWDWAGGKWFKHYT